MPGNPLLKKMTRFGIVGIANTGVDFAVFAIAVNFVSLPIFANVIAWSVAVSFSYVINSRWTFMRDKNVSLFVSIVRFISLGALISLGVSTAAVQWLTDFIGLWPAKILGTLAAMVLNFIAAMWSIEGKVSK